MGDKLGDESLETETLTASRPEAKPTSKTRQFIAAIVINLYAFSQGTVIGWLAPTEPLLMSDESPIGGKPLTHENVSWLGSLVCFGAILVIPIASFISNKYSRKMTGYLMALPLIPAWTMVILAQSPSMLYAARFIAGLGCGGGTVSIPQFVHEIAEDSIRGEVGTYIALFFNSGVLFTFIVGSYVSYKVLGYVLLAVTLIYLATFTLIPESPHYFISIGNTAKARQSLEWLRGENNPDVEREIERMTKRARELDGRRSIRDIIRELTSKGTIKGLIIGVGVCANLQLSGVLAVLSYTVNIFKDAGVNMSPYAATIIIASIQIIATYGSSVLVDRLGRRILLISSNSLIVVCLGILGGYFYLKQSLDVSGFNWVPLAALSLFVIVVAFGAGSLCFLIISEIFSENVRIVAQTICLVSFWTLMFMVIKLFPTFVNMFGLHGCFWFYASCCGSAILFVYFFVPETKNRSLESILKELNGDKDTEEDNYKKNPSENTNSSKLV
uniref:Major facilitator superfamily (MFS) profile domain-containing protein n=1 Tax=Timema douglasi TaxID=61478 RepID=A0A7R8VH76_TIMDO|nr:unnamed protein product [Timema douglasi]